MQLAWTQRSLLCSKSPWKPFEVSKPHRRRSFAASRLALQCNAGAPDRPQLPTNAGWIPASKRRADWEIGPSFALSPEDAVQMQLEALRDNDVPQKDHGIEVLYRFADFDLLSDATTLSRFFGRFTDIGRFELFRLQFNEPPFSLLLNHTDSQVTSSLKLSDTVWVQRIAVTATSGQKAVFDFTMNRRTGGRHDGYWFTHSLLHDSTEE